MRYSDMRQYDVSNWSGINATIFFSGCWFKCKGCFNKKAQDFNYGKEYTKEEENRFIEMCKNEHVDGVCILGGEVFQQDLNRVYTLVKRIKEEVNKPIHIWTGFLFEDLLISHMCRRILTHVDTIVDGQFILDKKDLSLRFRGSSNQRVIDVQKSLSNNQVVLLEV